MTDYRLKGIPKVIFGGNGSSDETNLKLQLKALQSELDQMRDALHQLKTLIAEVKTEYAAIIKSRSKL